MTNIKKIFSHIRTSAHILVVLLIVICPFSRGSASTDGSASEFFDTNWGNLQEELVTARKEEKVGILIMWMEPDCPWCEKMKATTLRDSEVISYFKKHFRIFELDEIGDGKIVDFAGVEKTERELAHENRARVTPTFIFYDLEGRSMTTFVGSAKNAKQFLLLGQFVVSGEYKKADRTFRQFENSIRTSTSR